MSATQERVLLEAAQRGDEDAFRRLIEPRRPELHAHCYRMLASVHDAEDALQEGLLRAWRSLGRFEGRSSVRTWLYRIVTNTCLDIIGKRPKRVLPMDQAAPTDGNVPPGEPLVESVWIEPYPDETLGVEDGYAAPDARYEERESVELAFIAALQHLPPLQRAVLIMREVLGFSAAEVAELLETTVPAVNSALQRARAATDDRLPEQSQQATLRLLGDDELRAIVDGYVDAWERGDVDAVVAMLAEDAALAMPPLASWYRGRESIAAFLRGWPLSGLWRWRHVRTVRANGQPAIGCYAWDDDEQLYLPFALEVLDISDGKISHVTAFVTREARLPQREVYERWVEQPAAKRGLAMFERFDLPESLS